jgi:protein-disulfide isomerase
MLALVNVQRTNAQNSPQVAPKPAPPAAVSQPKPPGAPAGMLSDAASKKTLAYFRTRIGLRDDVKVSLGALHASSVAPGYLEGIITMVDGAKQAEQRVLVSRDAHFFITVQSNVIDLGQDSNAEMAQRIQQTFKIPASTKVAVGGFKPSASPAFQEGTLTLDDGTGHKRDFSVLLGRDGKHLMIGNLYNMSVDTRQQALHTISLRDEPSQGPANAPVTIVEYADLECPTCARVHEFLETQLLPRYGNKLRVVFKEFPLPMHDWSLTAAVACQCAYEINHEAYVPLRSAIFRNQQLINIANLRETLLSFGEQAGLDRVQLAGCLDAKSSLPRVERDAEEGKRLGVDRTPTLFFNGRMVVGLPSEDAYYQIIDEELKQSK